MKLQLNIKNFEMTPYMNEHWEIGLAKIKKQLLHFPEDTLSLHAKLEKHHKTNSLHTSLTLFLASQILHAEKDHIDPLKSMTLGFQDLLRQVQKHKSRLRKESDYHSEKV